MITYTGRNVFPSSEEAPSIVDIAAGLGRTARWGGQTKIYYTVLAHTFVTAAVVSDHARIYAMLHDAPEAVVGDVVTTWKSDVAKNNEDELMHRICREHGIVWPSPPDLWAEVMAADYAALQAEAHILGHIAADEYWPNGGWSELTWKARDETLKRVNEGCIWSIDPTEASAVYSELFDRAMKVRRPDTISKPITN